MAVITALLISLILGKKIINYLQRKQVGEVVRDLGLEGQYRKQGTPSMGGLIILISIVIPVLLFARLDNVYIILMLVTTVWLGLIGFLDDYIKIFKKRKEGLAGRYKMGAQIILGLIVGVTLYFSEQAVVREFITPAPITTESGIIDRSDVSAVPGVTYRDVKTTRTTIPFIKNNEFDYSWQIGRASWRERV